MSSGRSAIVTVAMGKAAEDLGYTFTSFAERNPGVPLHAFIIGAALPKNRRPEVTYHLVAPTDDFCDPLREIYFRRLELIDQLDVEFALVVDSYDVLCLQTLPPLPEILGSFAVAACVEHSGSRYILGQGYTSNFLNGGVFFWNVPESRTMRQEISARGRRRFRTVADDQYAINEVIQTKYFQRLRILPSHYNYRPFLLPPPLTRSYLVHLLNWLPVLKHLRLEIWPAVTHLDGVMIYHNATSMKAAKELVARHQIKPEANLPALPEDQKPLGQFTKVKRKIRTRLGPDLA